MKQINIKNRLYVLPALLFCINIQSVENKEADVQDSHTLDNGSQNVDQTVENALSAVELNLTRKQKPKTHARPNVKPSATTNIYTNTATAAEAYQQANGYTQANQYSPANQASTYAAMQQNNATTNMKPNGYTNTATNAQANGYAQANQYGQQANQYSQTNQANQYGQQANQYSQANQANQYGQQANQYSQANQAHQYGQQTNQYSQANQANQYGQQANQANTYASMHQNNMQPNIAGTPDANFDSERKGYVVNQVGATSEARATAVQYNNKIVVAGVKDGRGVLIRYNNDSSPDTAFGGPAANNTGMVTNNNPHASSFGALALQPDRKIVAAGKTGTTLDLRRFYENGTPDPLFGNNGIADTKEQLGEITALALQGDHIIAAGNDTSGGIVLARFDSDGVLDTRFAQAPFTSNPKPGIGITKIGSEAHINAIAMQQDNKIVAVGSVNKNQMLVVRYTHDGKLDATFGNNGVVMVPNIGNSQSSAYGVAIQQDQKIVVVGQSNHLGDNTPVFTTIRLNDNGTFDTSFGNHGMVTTRAQNGLYPSYARSVAVTNNGKIVVSGYSKINNKNNFTVVRYDSHGNLDQTFGQQGIQNNLLNVNAMPNNSTLPAVSALQQNGAKLVVVGNYAPNATAAGRQIAVARYLM